MALRREFFLAVTGAIFGAGVFSSAATVAPPSTQPTIQSLKQEEYLRQLQEKTPLAAGKTTTLDKLIRIHLRDGRLVADSPLKTEAWMRVGLGNPLLLCIVRQLMPDFLQLTLDDFTGPDNVYVQTEILTAPGQLQIAGSWEFAHAERLVTLIDKYADLDEQGRPVPAQIRLIVQEISDSGGETINLTLAAPSWAVLLREHPKELRKYFRPILIGLHNDTILQPDRNVQWQIFGPRAVPDPRAVNAVQKLLPLLDSESFSKRQSALRELIALNTPGAIALMHIDPRSLSAEQSARIADVLLPYRQLSSQQAADLSQQPEFLLDCMDSDDPQLRRLASEQLASVVKHSIIFDPNATLVQREPQLSNLRQTLLSDHQRP